MIPFLITNRSQLTPQKYIEENEHLKNFILIHNLVKEYLFCLVLDFQVEQIIPIEMFNCIKIL